MIDTLPDPRRPKNDGGGKRVKKVVLGGETTVFVYDAGGKLIGEYSSIVQIGSNAKTVYTTNDHLGSPRINTDATGQVISRHDYHPFGEEVDRTSFSYGSDTIRKQFTGYERDGETGLDYAQARYYAKSWGRFSSADEAFTDQEEIDPQSWNLYVYVRNRPLLFVDPDGLGHVDAKGNWVGDEDGEYDKELKATWRVDPNQFAGGYWDFDGDKPTVTREWNLQDELTYQGILWVNRDAIRGIDDDGCEDCPVVREMGVGGAALKHVLKGAVKVFRGKPSVALDKSMRATGAVRPANSVAHHIVAHGSKKQSWLVRSLNDLESTLTVHPTERIFRQRLIVGFIPIATMRR